MRALIQRVKWAKVSVDGKIVGEIDRGLLTFLGVGEKDSEQDLDWIIQKILKLRIFEDTSGKMNLSLKEIEGSHLIVSQFTLYGDASKGNRPSFITAAKPEQARELYLKAVERSREAGISTETGRFQAEMEVSLLNDGPVTLWLESPPTEK